MLVGTARRRHQGNTEHERFIRREGGDPRGSLWNSGVRQEPAVLRPPGAAPRHGLSRTPGRCARPLSPAAAGRAAEPQLLPRKQASLPKRTPREARDRRPQRTAQRPAILGSGPVEGPSTQKNHHPNLGGKQVLYFGELTTTCQKGPARSMEQSLRLLRWAPRQARWPHPGSVPPLRAPPSTHLGMGSRRSHPSRPGSYLVTTEKVIFLFSQPLLILLIPPIGCFFILFSSNVSGFLFFIFKENQTGCPLEQIEINISDSEVGTSQSNAGK